MARIDDLPPDQRAALQLLLKQGRSYDEIASLLRIEPRAVRERARAALDALGPEDVEGLELDEQDDVADYLLGQQSASRRAATRTFLEQSAPGRAWARVVAGELRPMAGDSLPDIPSEAAEVDEAFGALQARTEHRERTQRSSRVGGAILLAGLGVLVAGVLALVLGVFGDDDGDEEPTARTGTTTAQTQTQTQPGGQPEVLAQINLQPPEGAGGEQAGVAQVARQGERRAVALVAQDLPAARRNPPRFYAIWLAGDERSQFLGFPDPQPGRDGRIETGFALPDDVSRFNRILVTRETQQRPQSPGDVVLSGRLQLQGGNAGAGAGGGAGAGAGGGNGDGG